MYKLTSILLSTLVVSSLIAAPPATKTDIPVELQSAIEATRHAVEPDGAGFRASNPRQDMELHFQQSAATVRLPNAEARLRLSTYGRESAVIHPRPAKLTATANRVEYRRGALTEWYINDKRGVEQGFTVKERPAGSGALVVALEVEGELRPRLEGMDRVVLERDGAALLRYGGLKAWDADGKVLRARMDVTGRNVRLRVEDAGAAYPVTIDPWLQQAKLTASDGAGFGSSVALSGNTALVGADFTASGSGAVYVYVRNGTTWTQQAKLTASDGAPSNQFGYSVALSGDTAVVGTNFSPGASYVYVRSGTVWTEQTKLTSHNLGDDFGLSVAISGDTIVVGARRSDPSGAAYVYVRNTAGWTEQAKLTASDANGYGLLFGGSVAISGDTAIVGAPVSRDNTGAAYVYARSATAWVEQARLSSSVAYDQFGKSVAISGNTALVGTFNGEAAYVYVRSATVWTEQAKLTSPLSGFTENFGWSVALSGDTAVVGAPMGTVSGEGAAYLYGRTGTVWTEQNQLTASDGVSGGEFGWSVAFDVDTALVGAIGQPASPGAAYMFTNLHATANLSINPISCFPGATVTLSGSGFAPFETVKVYNYSNGLPLGTGFADSSGSATVTVRVPAAPWGRYDVVAIGETSGKSGTAPFSVTPRLVLNPNTGTAGGTTIVQGYGFGAGETVQVYWNSPRAFLGTSTADSRGSFPSLTFTIPVGATLGDNIVLAKGKSTGAVGGGHITIH